MTPVNLPSTANVSERMRLLWARNWALLLALAAAILPAFWYGPLLPLLDSIGFAALHSYPGVQSYGPAHYYVFSYTYMLPHILSRAMADFGIAVGPQVLIYYVLQGVVFLVVVWKLLELLIPDSEYRAFAVLAGAIAFWDGLFLWGGPLAFSLGGTLWLVAVWISAVDATRTEALPRTGLFLFLTVTALVSHPLSAIFVLPLAGLRVLFVASRRFASLATLGGLAAYAFLMTRDNPEPSSDVRISGIFGLTMSDITDNLHGLLTHDREYISEVFRTMPFLLDVAMTTYGVIRLVGLLATPWLLWRHRRQAGVAFLLAVNASIALLYLCALPNPWVNQWPKRVISFSGGLTFVVGMYAIWLCIERLPALREAMRRPVAGIPALRLAGVAAAVLLVGAEAPILSLSRVLESNLASLRESLRESKIDGKVIRVEVSSIQGIVPAYLRALPLMLFSERELLARGAMVHTEWHMFGRHNSRLAADHPYVSPPQRTVRFDMGTGKVRAQFADGDRKFSKRMRVRFEPTLPVKEPGGPLLVTGSVNDANFLYVISPAAGRIRFGLDRWGTPGARSEEIAIDPAKVYDLFVTYDEAALAVRLDGAEVFRVEAPLKSLASPHYGENIVGGTSAMPKFPGLLEPL